MKLILNMIQLGTVRLLEFRMRYRQKSAERRIRDDDDHKSNEEYEDCCDDRSDGPSR